MSKSEYRSFFVDLNPQYNIAYVKCLLCNKKLNIGSLNHKNVSHMKVNYIYISGTSYRLS